MSPISSAASDSRVLAVTTLTVIGTSCRLCSRRCAVTTTSSSVVASCALTSRASTSCALARPDVARAASATLPASVAFRQCSILIIAAPPKAPFSQTLRNRILFRLTRGCAPMWLTERRPVVLDGLRIGMEGGSDLARVARNHHHAGTAHRADAATGARSDHSRVGGDRAAPGLDLRRYDHHQRHRG